MVLELKLTHTLQAEFKDDEWDVEDQSSDHEQGGVKKLYLGVVHDGSDYQVYRRQENDDRNWQRNLDIRSIKLPRCAESVKSQYRLSDLSKHLFSGFVYLFLSSRLVSKP